MALRSSSTPPSPSLRGAFLVFPLEMQAGGATTQAVQGVSHASSSPLLVKWLCLCLGRLVEDQPELLSQVKPGACSSSLHCSFRVWVLLLLQTLTVCRK